MKRSILGVLLVLAFVAVGIAAAPPLTFTYSNVKAKASATETDTYGVNDAGVIVGDYVDSAGVQHGMIKGTTLKTVNNSSCQAITGTGGIAFYGINSLGAATGWCTSTTTGLDIAFVYKSGKFTAVNFPGSNGTQATGINDKGEVVGLYLDSANSQHGFSKIGTTYKSIDVPNETSTAAWGVNNKGQITVYAVNSAGGFDAFLKSGTTFKKINDANAGSLGTVVHAPAPNTTDIDGTYYDSAGNVHGWLLHAGVHYTLDDPTGCKCDTRADGLNDKLEAVGRYSTTLGGASIGFKVQAK